MKKSRPQSTSTPSCFQNSWEREDPYAYIYVNVAEFRSSRILSSKFMTNKKKEKSISLAFERCIKFLWLNDLFCWSCLKHQCALQSAMVILVYGKGVISPERCPVKFWLGKTGLTGEMFSPGEHLHLPTSLFHLFSLSSVCLHCCKITMAAQCVFMGHTNGFHGVWDAATLDRSAGVRQEWRSCQENGDKWMSISMWNC